MTLNFWDIEEEHSILNLLYYYFVSKYVHNACVCVWAQACHVTCLVRQLAGVNLLPSQWIQEQRLWYAIWKTNTFTLWNISLARTILLIQDLTKTLVCFQTVNCKYIFVEGIYVNYILNMYCLADYIGFTRIGLINPLNLKMQFMKNEYSI